MFGRLIMALVLGGLVGLERELHGRAAGLRTHILVTVGSCLIMVTSLHLWQEYHELSNIDPGRVAAQVVSGIGFLGAGTILRFRASVRGLTTAASLWAAAGIGLATGSGYHSAAIFTTGIVLFTLFLLTRVERRIVRRDWYKVLRVETRGEVRQLEEIRGILGDYAGEIKDLNIAKGAAADRFIIEISLKLPTSLEFDQILSDVGGVEGVLSAAWKEG